MVNTKITRITTKQPDLKETALTLSALRTIDFVNQGGCRCFMLKCAEVLEFHYQLCILKLYAKYVQKLHDR